MNHFDYFSEIEGAFVRRRGRNLLLSPVDWALIESWEKQGVPLKIVLSTIDEVFDQVEADPKRAGSVRTLSYCKDAVEARYRNWRESHVGSAAPDVPERPLAEPSAGTEETLEEDVASRLAGLAEELERSLASVRPELREQVSAAAAELRGFASAGGTRPVGEFLERLDREIDEALIGSLSENELADALEAAEAQIGGRRSSMDEEDLARTTELIVKKRLRGESGVPPLGLYRL